MVVSALVRVVLRDPVRWDNFRHLNKMASVGATRKLFVDSRYKVSGTDSDFTIELPVDIDCTRTSSFFLASCSFAKIHQTVTP